MQTQRYQISFWEIPEKDRLKEVLREITEEKEIERVIPITTVDDQTLSDHSDAEMIE